MSHPQSSSDDTTIDPLTTNDLADLPPSLNLSTEDYFAILRTRFLEGIIYTSLSAKCLVTMNPFQFNQVDSDQHLLQWSEEFADCGDKGIRGRLGPHVWEMSGRAYYFMTRTGQDQTFMLHGATGSGKSESSRLLVKSLIDLSAPLPGKKGSKVAQSIPAATFILDSFGQASTLANTNASRFGRYLELQFSDKGRLVGMKSLEYFLEKSRVTGAGAGERNFHVLYYLVAGATHDERQHLRLDASATSPYLSHSRISTDPSSPDAVRFGQLKDAFKTVGFPKKAVASICQLLVAVLHLGTIEFHVDRNRSMDSCVVKNVAVLEIIADFLGVTPSDLEFALTNSSLSVHGELCAVFLDVEGAMANRNELARALYGLVFSWIGEFMNEKLCRDDFASFISIIDFPGPVHSLASNRDGCGVEAFALNLASERFRAFTSNGLFDSNKAAYRTEGVGASLSGLETPYNSNQDCVRLLTTVPGGLVHIIDDQSRRPGKSDTTMLKSMAKRWGSNPNFKYSEGVETLGRAGSFTCSHWDGPVTYSSESFLADNSPKLSTYFVSLLGGTTPKVGAQGKTTLGARDELSTGGSSMSFVRQLFSSGAVETTQHPKSEDTLLDASQKVGPRRAPSTRRVKGRQRAGGTDEGAIDEDEEAKPPASGRSVVKEADDALSVLLSTASETQTWHIFSISPNDSQLPNQIDAKSVKLQIRALGLPEMSKRLHGEWAANLELKEWWERYQEIEPLAAEGQLLAPLVYRDKAAKVKEIMGWSDREMAVAKTRVFLSMDAFRYLEDFLRSHDPNEHQRVQDKLNRDVGVAAGDLYSPYGVPSSRRERRNSSGTFATSIANMPLVTRWDSGEMTPGLEYDEEYDRKTFMTDDYAATPQTGQFDEERSLAASVYASSRPMFDAKGMPIKDERDTENQETTEEVKDNAGRKRWVALTWLFTWWVPSFFLSSCGGMKRRDVRMAWREKLLINMLIWLLCGCAVFVIVFLGNLICPKEYVYSTSELASDSYNNDVDNMLVAIRGEAFDLSEFAPLHQPGSSVIPLTTIQKYGGLDATDIFPVQVSALCNAPDGSTINPYVTLESSNASTTVSQYHDFRAGTTDSRPDWYEESMIYLHYNFRKGFIGYTPSEISKLAKAGSTVAVLNGGVYDLSTYISNNGGGSNQPNGTAAPTDAERAFMSSVVVSLFQSKSGTDLSTAFNSLSLDSDTLQRQAVCLRNLFFIGKVDNRDSVQCQFARYILLALSIVMVSIIGFKFLAALQFGRRRKPEDYDKFVICQVPAYTEGEESLRNCIDSLARLKYDDKRKLLFIICDGNIVGSGNDRPTPSIVLDILGADQTIDPEPLSFLSIGDGAKQHNMGKVYSGLHEAAGHIVPYIVVVKVGKPSERSRPGNRGKRDSQMLLMRFLNRVHFDAPMAPLELELYHQIKNVIGVNPSFYEYLLMIDADTVVEKSSLNYLVGAFVEDKKVIGLCGETSLSNAKASWTTMMQVYEYFISHYMAKAFESLFGGVTCLPGCFSVYRIRTVEHKPVIIHNNVIREYGQNRVETLHVKNLLSLGEDRYLTTVITKEFPQYKMKFCRDAQAQTIAPDDWRVLMSQRRRWINSTIHNLAELLFVDKLCGFCCFSMRFVVFIDLLSTLIAPVTVAYIVYLIYLVTAEHQPIPTTALIMLGAIYGLQAIIFIIHRRFEHVGWMIVYILAIPFYSFILPLVSFWQMDDFSWGSTREIVGEKGKRMVVHDEGQFDPASIPLKSWQDFESELWEDGSNQSIGELAAASRRGDGESRYGAETNYEYDRGIDVPTRLSGRPSQFGQGSFGGSSQLDLFNDAGAAPSIYGTQASGSGFFGDHHRVSGSTLTLNEITPKSSSRAGTPAFSPSGATSSAGYLPPDETIIEDTQRILASADLSTLTKKGVRQELESYYGMELGDRKALVNRTIEQALGL